METPVQNSAQQESLRPPRKGDSNPIPDSCGDDQFSSQNTKKPGDVVFSPPLNVFSSVSVTPCSSKIGRLFGDMESYKSLTNQSTLLINF